MNEWKCRVEIELTDENQIDLRYFDERDVAKHLSWRMSLAEAMDLASWWKTEGCSLETRKLPLTNAHYGTVQITAYALTLIQVKGFDPYGQLRILGWSLPPPVIEAMGHYFAVHEEPNRSGDRASEHEGGLGQCNSVEVADPRQSSMTDRIAVYSFRSDPQRRHQTTTQEVKSVNESRKEETRYVTS